MIFDFLFKKEPPVPLSAGELLEIKIPTPKPPNAKEESFRYLYGKVIKISKKRNIFLYFTSRDKGENLDVGTDVTITAVKMKKIIRFPSKFLHQNDETFIFAPPVTVAEVDIPEDPTKTALIMSCPIEYRSFNTMHLQKATLLEISASALEFLANLSIPKQTHLNFEFFLPYRDTPIRIGGIVTKAEAIKDSLRHIIRFSIDEISKAEKDGLLQFALLANQSWK